jgi:hypothetical protein
VDLAAHLTTMTHGGQVVFTGDVFAKVKDTDLLKDHKRFTRLGKFESGPSADGTCMLCRAACGVVPCVAS